jgi:taurine dioxygenase
MFTLELKKIENGIGADIVNIDITQPLTDEMQNGLRQAWEEFLVLRFRGQPLTDPQLIAFSRNFGELEPPGPNPQGKPYLSGFPELNVIANIKQDGLAIGGLGDCRAKVGA